MIFQRFILAIPASSNRVVPTKDEELEGFCGKVWQVVEYQVAEDEENFLHLRILLIVDQLVIFLHKS